MDKNIKTIKTSQDNWLRELLELYIKRVTFIVIDDANIGLEKDHLTSGIRLLKSLKEKLDISWREIARLLFSIGIGGLGMYMVMLAIKSKNEKLNSVMIGGLGLIFMGAVGAYYALGSPFSVSIESPDGAVFRIEPK